MASAAHKVGNAGNASRPNSSDNQSASPLASVDGQPSGQKPQAPDELPLKITFGVEIECVIGFPLDAYPATLAHMLVKEDVELLLRGAGVAVQELRGYEPLSYDFWTINTDATIRPPGSTATHAFDEIEMQSRVLAHADPNSAEEIKTVLRAVHSHFDLITTPECNCGLHVHIGNEDRGFPLAALKRYALLVTGFEHLLLGLAPPHRFADDSKSFCVLPSRLSTMKHMSLPRRWEAVASCRTESQLQDLMSPLFHGKNVAFNLGSHADRSKKTIEHRLFAGTAEAEEIVACVELCACLVTFAHDASDQDVAKLLPLATDPAFGLRQFFSAIRAPGLWEWFGSGCR